jgi:hypothetical protein
LEWYGSGGGDRARDIVAWKDEIPFPGFEMLQK